jgi:hypothetical protein
LAIVSRAETEGQSGMAALAERYEVQRSATRTNKAPDAAILREAERGYDLVVLGVNRRKVTIVVERQLDGKMRVTSGQQNL